jgi:uncharacterized protein with HEPN domain
LKSDREYIDHIIEEIDFIVTSTKSISKPDFLSDATLKRAIVRSIEVIGEAVKNISPDLKKQYGGVDWRKIGDTRNRLIHGYFAIDYDIVWDIVTNKIPELKNTIEEIKRTEKNLWD